MTAMPTIERVTTPYSYSAAVRAGDYVFLGLHRGFGDTFAGQIKGALDGIEATLAQLGLPLDGLIKVTVRNLSASGSLFREIPRQESRNDNYLLTDL